MPGRVASSRRLSVRTAAVGGQTIREQIRSNTQAGRPILTCPVAIESLRPVSEGFWRVSVRGDGLNDYRHPWPADAFKLMLPPDGSGSVDLPDSMDNGLPQWSEGLRRPVLRAYTVRSFDPTSPRIDFDVAAHGDGLAMRWLRHAAPADVLAVTGMRREFFGAPDVDRHLLIGDCSAVPAIAAIIESLPDSPPATVVVAAEHASDLELIPGRANDRRIGLADVNPVDAGEALLRVLAAENRPPGRIQAWVGGEGRFVRRTRQLLLDGWQIARTDLQASAYWRAGQDATQVDAATVARYQSAMQRGLNLSDPDVLDQLELEG